MRILVVDDEPVLLESLARRFRRQGWSVDSAVSLAASLELLAGSSYDIVISDQNLGDGFGHTLLEHVATNQPGCRRLLMSGASIPDDVAISWEHFVAKPDGVSTLVTWLLANP